MQVPIRRGDSRLFTKVDPAMTEDKYYELQKKLDFMKRVKRPREAEEVKRLALMGDFSENTGYQIAKGRLRGLNQRIIELEDLLGKAEIIKPIKNSNTVQLGSKVTIERDGKIKTYQILGSTETNPESGTISHSSPLGSALLSHQKGETIKINLADKEVYYKILKIE
ncbi:MAG: GreA/GreB family elongation factor [Patescibacteria group bacterium]|jgi:transcription elongation factor GreA